MTTKLLHISHQLDVLSQALRELDQAFSLTPSSPPSSPPPTTVVHHKIRKAATQLMKQQQTNGSGRRTSALVHDQMFSKALAAFAGQTVPLARIAKRANFAHSSIFYPRIYRAIEEGRVEKVEGSTRKRFIVRVN